LQCFPVPPESVLFLFCSCSVPVPVPVLFHLPEQNREQNRFEISGTGTEQEQNRFSGTDSKLAKVEKKLKIHGK
jgi:hypothetical protein